MISREQAEKYYPAQRLPALEQSPADDGHLIGRDPRRMSISELIALGHQAGPLLAVIRAKCLDCVGDELGEVRKCTAVDCALWPFRMAHNPFRKIGQAQREQGRRLAARRSARGSPSECRANPKTPEIAEEKMAYAPAYDAVATSPVSEQKNAARRCESCDVEFPPTRPWSRFCSAACEQRARRARRPQPQNQPRLPSGAP
jgi:hypothetical protein